MSMSMLFWDIENKIGISLSTCGLSLIYHPYVHQIKIHYELLTVLLN